MLTNDRKATGLVPPMLIVANATPAMEVHELSGGNTEPRILLLDEPTSSVDVKNERLIYEGVFRTFKDKTIISSVHRLHLLPLFDRMYFFKNGRIIASGTLGELLKSSEEFKRMWKKYHGTQRERPEKKF